MAIAKMIFVAVLVLVPSATFADCGHFFKKQAVVVHQVAYVPQVFVPPVYYAAGDDLRIEAAVERALRARLEYADGYGKSQPVQAPQIQAPQIRQPVQAPPLKPTQAPPPTKGDPDGGLDGGLSLTGPPPFAGGAFAKCARCHTGPKAKAGLVLDGRSPITAEHFRRWGEIAGQSRNIPEPMRALVNSMTPEQKGAVADAMLNTPLAAAMPPPVPPVPEADPVPPPVPEGNLQ